MASVTLRKRDDAVAETRPPVWSLERHESTLEQTPLKSVCDQHNRVQCCRDLKGDDERTLLDPDIVRDAIIGLADGLTVPFALTAGLASLNNSKLVVIAGLAELFSGAISMGVGGFLASEADRNHYRYMVRTTCDRVRRSCSGEMEREVHAILGPVGIDEALSRRIAGALTAIEARHSPPPPQPSMWRKMAATIARKPKSTFDVEGNGSAEPAKLRWEDEQGLTAFLLKFGEGMEDVPTSRLFISAATIGLGYFIGGLIPMIPYFVESRARIALYWSIGLTAVILLAFGAFKSYYTGAQLGFSGYAYGSLSTMAVGGAAAAASWGIVSALDTSDMQH